MPTDSPTPGAAPLPSGAINIYNASGVLVRTLTLATAGPAGGLQFSTALFQADGLATVSISGSGLSFAWNGRDSAGQLVLTGEYTIQLLIYQKDGSVTQQWGQLTVEAKQGGTLFGHAWPNPARDTAHLSMSVPVGSNLDIRLYDLVGELVRETWQVKEAKDTVVSLVSSSGRPLANGIYIVTVDVREPGTASVQRLNLKLVILK